MPARYKHNAPVHLNGNLYAAVDVETTGLDSSKHDIIEICILPLMGDYTPCKEILPFDVLIKPRRPENVDPDAMAVNKIELAQLMINGLDSDRVADLLIEWFERLELHVNNKKIVPIAQNWPFDKSFISEWLGRKNFDYIFDRQYRDTMTAALFLNDRADICSRPIEFPKVNLQYLSTTLKVENPDKHRALGDCVTTAEIYRRLLHRAM